MTVRKLVAADGYVDSFFDGPRCVVGFKSEARMTTTTTTTISNVAMPTTSIKATITTTYIPQPCNGVFEAAGCGTRIPTGDCAFGGVHQQFAETHCPKMCGLGCEPTEITATASTTTPLTTAANTATATNSTTTTTWLDVHALCNPLEDFCDQSKGLFCDGTFPYSCRYKADLGLLASAAAQSTDDGGGGGGSNAALYACIGIIGLLVLAGGILAVFHCRGGRGSQPNNQHHDKVVTIAQNPTYAGPFGVDANAADSAYAYLGGVSEEAAYEDVAGHAVLNNETYDTMDNGDGSDDLDC